MFNVFFSRKANRTRVSIVFIPEDFSHRRTQMDSILTALKKDHTSLLVAYQKFLSAKGNLDEQTRWANEFRWELARHSAAEELVVYPKFETNLGAEGKRIADEDRAQHYEAKKLLFQLENSQVNDPHYESTFEKLVKIVKDHVNGEENNDLPKLEKTLSREESAALARAFEITKMFVATRVHLNAPDKQPFEAMFGLMAAPFDKFRDLFDKFPIKK